LSEHHLVRQLRFTRNEFIRGLDGVAAADGIRRLAPLNSIGWTVGHLANQEHGYWVVLAQQKVLFPGLRDLVGTGKPASTPPLGDRLATWRAVTREADAYLDTLTPELALTFLRRGGSHGEENVGTLLLRTIYHYWFHTGEAAAVRQLLGHASRPEFVGPMGAATYEADDRLS